MISFNYETEFELGNEKQTSDWISNIIGDEGFKEGEINYIFCDDDYLYNLNVEFLNHDTLTDVIGFDYSVGKELHGDIYISVDRVRDNSSDFNVSFRDELSRVMAHSILHFCGYKDKFDKDRIAMKSKEDFYIDKLSRHQ